MFSGLIPVARELRDAKAKDSESRLDLATQLVKQAYSECPNLDLLIGAILSNPLYRCAVKRVLQRRAGSSFSCYYLYRIVWYARVPVKLLLQKHRCGAAGAAAKSRFGS